MLLQALGKVLKLVTKQPRKLIEESAGRRHNDHFWFAPLQVGKELLTMLPV